MNPAYICSKCGLGVIVIPNEKPIKACECNASITMSMESDLIGKGGVAA